MFYLVPFPYLVPSGWSLLNDVLLVCKLDRDIESYYIPAKLSSKLFLIFGLIQPPYSYFVPFRASVFLKIFGMSA